MARAALVASGRRSCASGEWSAALAQLSAARAAGELEADDLARMARCAWMLGRVGDSLPLSEAAYRMLRHEGRSVDAAMTAMRLSLLWLTRGDLTVGTAWLGRARRILAAEPDGPEHAYLAYLDASVGMLDGGEAWTDASVRRLEDLAARFPEPAVESLSMVVAGMAALRVGRTRAGFALLDEAMLPVLAEELPLEWAGDIYCTTIHMCSRVADFRRMEGWTAATERWCARLGSESIYTGICRVHRLELQWSQGQWADAEDGIARASADVAHASPWVAAEGYYQLGEMRRMRGDEQGARQAFALVLETGMDAQPGAALLELQAGHVAAARMAIADALAEHDGIGRVRLLRAAVEIALADGARREAAVHAEELRAAAAQYESDGFRAWSLHAAGMVALARGDAGGAVAALQAACGIFRQTRQLYETARVLALIGRALEAEGQPGQAERVRAQAARILVQLGAQPIDEPGDGRQDPDHVGPLTARESEVLEQVARGGSNRVVARHLGISEKTVGRHLANIYLKLAVGSRTAAAAWWHAHVQ